MKRRMATELRSQLHSLRQMLGMVPQGPSRALFEATDEEVDKLINSIYVGVSALAGREYPTVRAGVAVVLDDLFLPLRDPIVSDVEFIVPLDVSYTGEAPPEVWSDAEKAMEKDIIEVIKGLAMSALPDARIRLLSRTKSDPYPDDPMSLTMLRFRVE